MSISDRIVLMRAGVLQQSDIPQTLYNQPANQFVADFLGNPPINNLHGTVEKGAFVLEDRSACTALPAGWQVADGKRVSLALRAESAELSQEGEMDCEVVTTYQMGKEEMAFLRFGTAEFRAYIPAECGLRRAERVKIALKKRGVFLFDLETGGRLA